MVDEPKEGQPIEEGVPAEEVKSPPAEPEARGNEEVDEGGVSYKNRYAEEKRKREQLAEQMEEMSVRMNNIEQRSSAPKSEAPQPTPKNDMDEMIALGPKAYNEKMQRQFAAQQAEAAAVNLVKEEFGVARAQFGVQKVLDYAQKNMIDLRSDPVRAVKKILNEMKKPAKPAPSAEERKKTAEAIKNKPEGGKRPPAPPVNNSSQLMDNVRTRGSVEDVAAALAEQWKQNGK